MIALNFRWPTPSTLLKNSDPPPIFPSPPRPPFTLWPVPYSPNVLLSTGFHLNQWHGFTQVIYSKGTQAISEASEWNEELEGNVWSERPPGNSAKHDYKDNPGTLPISL
jgi:hypothetical protein